MNNLKFAKLSVAKVCHEMANHLSIMKFLQEDLANSDVDEVKELLKTIDLLTLTMDFFRNIYANSGGISSVREILINIFKIKDITLLDNENVLSDLSNNFENVLCGVLYIIMKACKTGDEITVSKIGKNIFVAIPEGRALSKNVIDAFNNSVDEDIFNIFVNYIKKLANLENLEINLETENKNLRVKIWKK